MVAGSEAMAKERKHFLPHQGELNRINKKKGEKP